MPDGIEIGRIVRDPALSAEVVGRTSREGELEVRAVRTGDWTESTATIVPSVERAQAVQTALKDALTAQLEAEAANLGGDIGNVAVHGSTGVSL